MANEYDDNLFEHTVRLLLASNNGLVSKDEQFSMSHSADVKRQEEFKGNSKKKRLYASSENNSDQNGPPRVKFLERATAVTILVCWSDSCHGRFGEQIWSRGTAQADAICALSGKQIIRGDTVYHPRCSCRKTIANAQEVILASVISDYEAPDAP